MADRRLQVFHTVAKQLSFTKAGEVLFMTQPAVTFQIKQLEEHFDTRLFDRGHGRLSLTPAGETVFAYAEKILNLSAEMEVRLSEMTGEVCGPLLVGASMTIAEFLLPRILGEFKSHYPGVQPNLVVANSETIEKRIAEHALDIGFIESQSHNTNLQIEPCCDDELVVVCNPRFPLARLKEVPPDRLLDHPYVSREAGSGTREFTDAYLREHGHSIEQLNTVMELGSPVALNAVVETGLGYTIASRASVTASQRLGELVAIPLKPRFTRTLSMVYSKDKFRSKLVTTFVEFAAERLKQISAK